MTHLTSSLVLAAALLCAVPVSAQKVPSPSPKLPTPGPLPIPPVPPTGMPIDPGGGRIDPIPIDPITPQGAKPPAPPDGNKSAPKPRVLKPPTKASTGSEALTVGSPISIEGCIEKGPENSYVLVSLAGETALRYTLEDSGDVGRHLNERVKISGTTKAAAGAADVPAVVTVQSLVVMPTRCEPVAR